MTKQQLPFKKILIANRGEIACRIMRTAERMGIATVAVYSDADAGANHVAMADEAIHIGAAPAAESYLRIDAIVDAATRSGAEAVHPGFGFVSENAEFAKSLERAGIRFIGPPVNAMAEMGDKLRSKSLAASAGVNTIPGDGRIMADAADALAVAQGIGYPVMLKASAGGGGKGMRIARSDAEVLSGFESAANEARSSFGDDRMLVEKFIEDPRHIEIQIIADQHGSCVYLGERECSIQRRHQKVIEEAPSPFVTPAVRAAMGEQAVALAQAVDYVSAGTVEFVVDPERNFYFLEMNTRLQVEHPVTEFITGCDLVELMIRIAAGEPLPFAQADITLQGWAMEARIYAEDPDRNFVPSTGRIQTYRPPATSANVRIDTGVSEGSEISIYYDPMIAKLITADDTRDKARERLSDALDSFCIRGINHNVLFLNALVNHPEFIAGNMSTAFIEEHYPDGFISSAVELADNQVLGIVAAVLQYHVDMRAAGRARGTLDYVVLSEAEEYGIAVSSECRNTYDVTLGERVCRVTTAWRPHEPVVRVDIDAQAFVMQLERRALSWILAHGGRRAECRVLPPRAAELVHLIPEKEPPDLSKYLLSPMPGLLVRLNVANGDKVVAGQELAVVEAMKMENSLIAEQDSVVARCLVEVNQNLDADQAIIEFE